MSDVYCIFVATTSAGVTLINATEQASSDCTASSWIWMPPKLSEQQMPCENSVKHPLRLDLAGLVCSILNFRSPLLPLPYSPGPN
jgi:hypothetical protein